MAFKKRTSPAIEAAKLRATSLRSVDAMLDFGKDKDKDNQPVSLSALDKTNADTETLLDKYNGLLSQLDELGNQIIAGEKAAGNLASRLFSGVGTRYGKNSDEYEKAGGKRTDEIKRKPPVRKPKPQA